VRSFAEVLPLANAIRELAGKSRPLQAQDFVPTSKNVVTPADNPGNIDVGELQTRVTGIRSEFDTLFDDLQNAANAADVVSLRQRLTDIANAGFVHAFPLTAFGSGQAQLDALLAQNTSLQQRYAGIKDTYDKNLAKVNDAATKPPQKVALLRAMAQPFLGDDFVVLPRFRFTNASEIVAAQHESYDGTGFPKGLKGGEIPLGARILRVADALDALLTGRPPLGGNVLPWVQSERHYHRKVSISEAKGQIQRASGTVFDPRIVNAFLGMPDGIWADLIQHLPNLNE